MTQSIADFLRGSSLFEHLEEEQLTWLADQASQHEFSAGEVIIEEGSTVSSLYLIADGVVRVWTNSMGRQVELKKLGVGTYFGEVSLLSNKEATATVEVLQAPVRVVALPRAAVVELIKTDETVRKILEGVTLARAKDTIAKVLKES